MSLEMKIEFKISDASFKINGNIKEEQWYNIIENFLYRQTGQGVDNSERIEKDVYHFKLKWNSQYDNIYCQFDGGNLGFRDGILSYILSKLEVK